MSTPSHPDWLAELILREGESQPIDVHERDALMKAMRAAVSPDNLDEQRHREILAQALSPSPKPASSPPDSPFAPPSVEELAAASRLRNHFDSDPLVVSLRSAHQPSTRQPNAEMLARDVALTREAKSVVSRTRSTGAIHLGSVGRRCRSGLVDGGKIQWHPPRTRIRQAGVKGAGSVAFDGIPICKALCAELTFGAN